MVRKELALVSEEFKQEKIRELIRNYHVNKVTKGNGFAEKPGPLITRRWYQVTLLVTVVIGVVLYVLGASLLGALAPLLAVWIVPILFPGNPLEPFMWIVGKKPRLFEEIETIHARIGVAYEKAEWQIRQMQEMDLEVLEKQALYELAIFGPIHGKEAVKKNLPVILKFGRLSDLEFIQELADDLQVRKN